MDRPSFALALTVALGSACANLWSCARLHLVSVFGDMSLSKGVQGTVSLGTETSGAITAGLLTGQTVNLREGDLLRWWCGWKERAGSFCWASPQLLMKRKERQARGLPEAGERQ